MRHYFNKSEARYERKNGYLPTNNTKFLCILLSIIVFLIAVVVGMMLWIIYGASVKACEHGTKHMTSQPLNTETSSGKHWCISVTPKKINRPPTIFFVA